MGVLRILRDRKFLKHLVLALLLGLCLRLVFVIYFQAQDDDTSMYQELGRNLLDHHIYGLTPGDSLNPSDIRMPGYPIFLGILYKLFGASQFPILLIQALVDLGTCILTALLAASLAPEKMRIRIAMIALWIAATCPFVANYAAVALTEVLATFFTTAALLVLVWAYQRELSPQDANIGHRRGLLWVLGGLVVGLGTLFRPETPMIAAAVGLVLLLRWYRPQNWLKLLRVGVLMCAGVLTPLVPWAVRNWISLHEFQFLSARYVQMPDEFVPLGFLAWTHTWLVHYEDLNNVLYKLGEGPMKVTDMPDAAFDTPEERVRVAKLLESQQKTFDISPESDAGFGELARERTARHPFRTYLWIPLVRAKTMWFRPRTELLFPASDLWPPVKNWTGDPTGYLVTVTFAFMNLLYFALAFVGTYSMRHKIGIWFLISYLVLRTGFFAMVHMTPEPRLVIVCIPSLLALAALFWVRPASADPPNPLSTSDLP